MFEYQLQVDETIYFRHPGRLADLQMRLGMCMRTQNGGRGTTAGANPE